MLYDVYDPLPALANLLPDMAFIIKSNINNGINLPSCPFPTLVTPFPDIAFINQEAAGCISKKGIGAIIEVAIAAIIAPRNPRSSFFISCFSASVGPQINRPESLATLLF